MSPTETSTVLAAGTLANAGVIVATLALVVGLTLLATWMIFSAQRLNRLHVRTDAAQIKLQAALDQRAAIIATVEPALRTQAQAVSQLRFADHGVEARANKERIFNQAIAQSAVADHPAVVDSQARVDLAFRFYNEAVSDTRSLRLRPMVRFLKLAGTAPLPEYCDLNAAS